MFEKNLMRKFFFLISFFLKALVLSCKFICCKIDEFLVMTSSMEDLLLLLLLLRLSIKC